MIYMDCNATTRLEPSALEAMLPFLRDQFASPASAHALGRHAALAVERARAQVGALIGAERAEEIVFVSGGTEANHAALYGVARALEDRGEAPCEAASRRTLITSRIEHAATSRVIEDLTTRRRDRFEAVWLDVDASCQVRLEQARAALNDPRAALLSVMYANNEVGAVQPIAPLGELCRDRPVTFHVDGAQAVGKIPVDVRRDRIDLLSVVAHKLHGPKGIGALYVRQGCAWSPTMLGAGHERGRRAGTPNVPAIVGFGEACRVSLEQLFERREAARAMCDRLRAGLERALPEVHFTCPPSICLPHTLHVCFPGVLGAALLREAEIVAASTGSACHRADDPPSSTLLAIGLEANLARGSVRLSIDHELTAAQADRALAALIGAYRRLRQV